jgi:hypothetical protein
MVFPFWLRPRGPNDPPPPPTSRVAMFLAAFGAGAFLIAAIAHSLGAPGR